MHNLRNNYVELHFNYLLFTFTGFLAKTEMEDLRKAMPSTSKVLRSLHTNPGNNKLSMYAFIYLLMLGC